MLAAAPAMKPSKRRDMLIEHAEAARISRELVELRDDAPLPVPVDELDPREPERAALAAWLARRGSAASPRGSGWMAPQPARRRRRPRQGEPAMPDDAPAPVRAAGGAGAPFGPYETVTDAAALATGSPGA